MEVIPVALFEEECLILHGGACHTLRSGAARRRCSGSRVRRVESALGRYFYRIVAEGIADEEEDIPQSGRQTYVSVKKMLLLK